MDRNRTCLWQWKLNADKTRNNPLENWHWIDQCYGDGSNWKTQAGDRY